jgi:hypothetical protein
MPTPEINTSTRVKPSEDVLFQELQGETVLLNLKTGVYFGLDTVGTRIWQLLDEHEVLSDVVKAMLLDYDVTEQACSDDVVALVRRMEEHGIVTVGGRTEMKSEPKGTA